MGRAWACLHTTLCPAALPVFSRCGCRGFAACTHPWVLQLLGACGAALVDRIALALVRPVPLLQAALARGHAALVLPKPALQAGGAREGSSDGVSWRHAVHANCEGARAAAGRGRRPPASAVGAGLSRRRRRSGLAAQAARDSHSPCQRAMGRGSCLVIGAPRHLVGTAAYQPHV